MIFTLFSLANAFYYSAIGSHSGDFRVHQRGITLDSEGRLAFNQSTGFEFLLDDEGSLVSINEFVGFLSLQPDNTLKVGVDSGDRFSLNKTVLEVNLSELFVACLDNQLVYYTGDSSTPDCSETVTVGITAWPSNNTDISDEIIGWDGE